MLTDDDTRRNWEEYGDPDGKHCAFSSYLIEIVGKQSTAYGIALPSWIVDPSNKALVLSFYAIVFGILLPVVVGRWWSSSKKFSKDRVLNYTMGIFFQELKETHNVRKMLELLCASVEFRDDIQWRGQRDMDAVMELFKLVRDLISSKTGEKLELPKKVELCTKFCLTYSSMHRMCLKHSLYCMLTCFECRSRMRGWLKITTRWFQCFCIWRQRDYYKYHPRTFGCNSH